MHKAYLKAAVACAALGASVVLTTGPATAAPSVTASANHHVTATLAVDGDPIESDGNNDTGKWGLAGLLGLFGLFGYRKYKDMRDDSTRTASAHSRA